MNTNSSAQNSNIWLKRATEQLQLAGIETARLDCLILLEDCLRKDRGHILAHPELMLSKQHLSQLNKKISRRVAHTPLAYIREHTEFYGRTFFINQDVLEPRPESETMIEILKQLSKEASRHRINFSTIIDVGTGSGALAITAKLELPPATVCATDISGPALRIAEKNARHHGVDVSFYEGDLLATLPASVFESPYCLLANLPYVPDDYCINQAASHEPSIAIFGGHDGLKFYRNMFRQSITKQSKPHYILTESLPFQHDDLKLAAQEYGYTLTLTTDFIQVFTDSNVKV